MAVDTARPAPVPAPPERGTAPIRSIRDPAQTVVRRLVLIAAVAACAAMYVLHMSLPPNPLSPPQQDQQKVRLFIPQGWGFFTISPRRAQLSPMRPASGGGWTDAGAGHLAVPADGFGVNRIRRAQGTEMALLLRGVRAGDWTPCSEQPGQCLAAVRPLGRVHNLAARPTLCGPVGFVRQEPLPWAWRASAGRTVMPSSVLRLEVAC